MNKNRLRGCLVSMAVLLSAVFASVAQAIELPAGTKIEIVIELEVSSKHFAPNDQIPIRLHGAIEVGGIVLVEDGAKGAARVKSVQPAGKRGKPGRIEVDLVELEPKGAYKAEGDKRIAITSVDGPIMAEGKGRKILSYLFIFGLFIKGTEAVIPADKPFPATIAEDIMLNK